MARLSYVDPASATPEQKAVFDFIGGKFIGRLANFPKLVGNAPWVLRWLIPLTMVVQRDGLCLTDAKTRELGILKASLLNACRY